MPVKENHDGHCSVDAGGPLARDSGGAHEHRRRTLMSVARRFSAIVAPPAILIVAKEQREASRASAAHEAKRTEKRRESRVGSDKVWPRQHVHPDQIAHPLRQGLVQ